MDVNRPGKGKVMPTSSRPVIPHMSPNEVEDDIVKADNSSRAHHKVIKPISASYEDKGDEVSTEEAAYSPGVESIDKEQPFDQELNDKEVEVSDSYESEASESAGVDALASAAAEKRQAKQKLEEDTKKLQELEAMTLSNQYHVPIKTSSGSKLAIVVLSVIAGLIILAIIIAMLFMMGS